ncbi:MAG TPA: hypothetical protein VHE79_08560 [Spirochaetia bacterium]
MSTLLKTLRESGVDRAFGLLGLDFKELFESRIARAPAGAYADHEWIVRNVPVFGWVVNAVPRKSRMEELFWEEWFSKDGKRYHHVLYLHRPERWDEVFVAPEHDDIHPEPVLGRTWYVIDERDMTPLLMRKQ